MTTKATDEGKIIFGKDSRDTIPTKEIEGPLELFFSESISDIEKDTQQRDVKCIGVGSYSRVYSSEADEGKATKVYTNADEFYRDVILSTLLRDVEGATKYLCLVKSWSVNDLKTEMTLYSSSLASVQVGKLDNMERASILYDILKGLAIIHRNGLVHGDLTKRNVLVKMPTVPKSPYGALVPPTSKSSSPTSEKYENPPGGRPSSVSSEKYENPPGGKPSSIPSPTLSASSSSTTGSSRGTATPTSTTSSPSPSSVKSVTSQSTPTESEPEGKQEGFVHSDIECVITDFGGTRMRGTTTIGITTPFYCPQRDERMTPEFDMYSLGMLLIGLWHDEPWKVVSEDCHIIGDTYSRIEGIPDNWMSLILSLTDANPSMRPTAAEILYGRFGEVVSLDPDFTSKNEKKDTCGFEYVEYLEKCAQSACMSVPYTVTRVLSARNAFGSHHIACEKNVMKKVVTSDDALAVCFLMYLLSSFREGRISYSDVKKNFVGKETLIERILCHRECLSVLLTSEYQQPSYK